MLRRIRMAAVPVLFGLSVLTAGAPALASQETSLADLGLPELNITVTADSFEGIPEELSAGRYLVNVTAAEEAGEFGGSVGFVQPVGVTVEEFLGLMMSGPPDETDSGAVPATPTHHGEATPPEGEEASSGPPAAAFESVYAGGTFAPPGQTAQVILDLTPGEWIAWGDSPEALQAPLAFAVTGEMPADLAEPESGATLTMGEYIISVSEGALAPGTQLVKIENLGAQPHFIAGLLGPDDLTEAQIEVALDEDIVALETGTPPVYSDFNPDTDVQEEGFFFSATQSTGTTLWMPITLEAGTYALLCFFPDEADGLEHAYHGMYTVIVVGE